MHALLHRWFIQYNPLYLLSSALVLIGVLLITRDLAQVGSLYGQLGVAAIAEVYAWTLIGGAAFLLRLGLRRPAVMLALLSLLYQSDVTLHTETCAHLGGIGVLAAALWLASFGGKLYALGWALRLCVSSSAILVPLFGALGLVALPWCFSLRLSPAATTPLVTAWLFALFASGLWTRREVRSTEPLNAWGSTVLTRATVSSWTLWAVLVVFHVLLWSSERGLSLSERGLDLRVLLPMALLLGTRFLRRESSIWAAVSLTLLWVAVALPSLFSLSAAMGAIVLGLRALRQPFSVAPPSPLPAPSAPYRIPGADASPADSALPSVGFALAARAALPRLFTGALLAAYLSIWTIGWKGGAWPEHVVALDLLLGLAIVALAWKARTRLVLVPLAVAAFHFGVQIQLITAPSSKLEWGLASVALGFALLFGSLFVSWRVRKLEPHDTG